MYKSYRRTPSSISICDWDFNGIVHTKRNNANRIAQCVFIIIYSDIRDKYKNLFHKKKIPHIEKHYSVETVEETYNAYNGRPAATRG